MDDPHQGSLQVDTAPVARRRSAGPVLAATLAAGAFILVALLKPWAWEPAPAAGEAASGRAPATIDADASPGLDATALPVRPADDDAVTAAARPRSEWGVRAIVTPGTGRDAAAGVAAALEERWVPVEVEADPPWDLPVDGITVDDGGVVALGVTTPADVLALDVRVWRVQGVAMPRRVSTELVPAPEPGSWLWRPGLEDATVSGAWPAGTYRLDVLLGPRIVRLLAVVRWGDPSPFAEAGEARLPADLEAAISPLDDGLFVITDGMAVAIPARARSPDEWPLDEREAWLARRDERLPVVGDVASSAVAGIGAVLPAGAWAPRAWLDVVSSIAGNVAAPTEVIPLGPAGVGAGRSAVVVHSAGQRPFATGVYRLTVMWRTASGERRWSTWTVDVRPRRPPVVPLPLTAVRRWAAMPADRLAASDEPVVTERDRSVSDGGLCGPRETVSGHAQVLGVLIAPGPPVVSVRLYGMRGFVGIDTRAATAAADGLAVVALPRTGLAPGRYLLRVVRSTGTAERPATVSTSYDVCVS